MALEIEYLKIMKTISNKYYLLAILIVSQTFNPFDLYGFNVFKFYKDLNKANYYHLIEENYNKSSYVYELILKKYDTLLLQNNSYCFAIESALKSNNNSLLSKLLKRKIYFDNDTTILDHLFIDVDYKYHERLMAEISNLNNSEIYKIVKTDFKFRTKYYYNLDPEFMKLVTKIKILVNEDQGIRRNNNNKINEVDSINIVELVNTLKLCKNIYQQSILINQAGILLTHSFRYNIKKYGRVSEEDYEYLTKILYQGLKSGNIPNRDYARYLDNARAERGYTNSKYGEIKQIYGTFMLSTLNEGKISNTLNPIEDIKSVDSLRAKIGLPTLFEDSIYYSYKLPQEYSIPKQPIY